MLRLLTEQDLPALLRAEISAQNSPWDEDLFKKCLELGSFGWVINVHDDAVAFILLLLQAGDAHILNFCVHQSFQHRGFGTMLLEHALEECIKNKIKIMYLEVRRSNDSAIHLYEKMGFVQIGERKDYYVSKELREDALVFAKKLIE